MTMDNTMKAVLSGFAGAVVLTALHQVLKETSRQAPALDRLGMESMSKGLRAVKVKEPESLYEVTMAADLISNGIYYGLIGMFGRERAPLTGVALGVLAGVGAVVAPPKMGLDGSATGRSGATKALTVGLYASGGLAAGAVYG
jgi:hypothetical protein